MYKTRPNEPPIDSSRHLDQASVDLFVAAHHTLTYSNTVGYWLREMSMDQGTYSLRFKDEVMGVVPDRWYLDPQRSLDEQIATMNHQVAEYFANGQSLTLYGDALFLDIDMREDNLPIGSTYIPDGAFTDYPRTTQCLCQVQRPIWYTSICCLCSQQTPEPTRRIL